MPKLHAPRVTLKAIEFAKHISSNYPGLNLVFESHIAKHIHETLRVPHLHHRPERCPGPVRQED